MFWNTFYALCKKTNTSPNAVCASVGLSTAAATHWKNGVVPNLKTVSKLAEYFDVSIDYLLGKEEITVEHFSLDENTIVYRRNGKVVEETFTDEQMDRVIQFIATIK